MKCKQPPPGLELESTCQFCTKIFVTPRVPYPYVGVHKRTSFMLHQQCSACHACFTCMVRKWPYSCCFVGGCFQYFFKARSILSSFFHWVSLKSNRSNHTEVLTRVQLGRISVLCYQGSDFHLVGNLSIPVHAFTDVYADIAFSMRYVIDDSHVGFLRVNS